MVSVAIEFIFRQLNKYNHYNKKQPPYYVHSHFPMEPKESKYYPYMNYT